MRLINKLVYNGCVVLGIQHLDILDGKPQANSWKRAQDVHTLLDRFILQSFAHYIFISIPKEKDKLPSDSRFLITDASGVDRQWIQFEVARNASGFFQSVFSDSPDQKF